MKKRVDLDCIGYLSDVLFEKSVGAAPSFGSPKRPPQEPKSRSSLKAKVLSFSAAQPVESVAQPEGKALAGSPVPVEPDAVG